MNKPYQNSHRNKLYFKNLENNRSIPIPKLLLVANTSQFLTLLSQNLITANYTNTVHSNTEYV